MKRYIFGRAALATIAALLASLLWAQPGQTRELTAPAPGKLKVAVFKEVAITSGQTRLYPYERKFFEELNEMEGVEVLSGPETVDLYGQPAGYWFNLAAKGAPTLFKKFQDQNIDYLILFTLKVMTASSFMNVHLVDTRAPGIKSWDVVRYYSPGDARTMGGFQSAYLKARRQFYEHASAAFPQALQQKGTYAGRRPAPVPRPRAKVSRKKETRRVVISSSPPPERVAARKPAPRQKAALPKGQRGWLGLAVQPLNRKMARSLGLKSAQGVLVARVARGGPAHKAGIKKGDVLVSFDNRRVTRPQDLIAMLARNKPGKRVKIRMVRRGRAKTVRAVLGSAPSAASRAPVRAQAPPQAPPQAPVAPDEEVAVFPEGLEVPESGAQVDIPPGGFGDSRP